MKPPNENQSRIIWFALTALAIAVFVGVTAGFVWGIGRILDLFSPVLWPLAIGAVAAYLLDPAVNWLEYRKVPRAWGIILVFAFAAAIVVNVLSGVIPQLMEETNELVSKIPGYTMHAQQRIEDWANRAEKAAVAAQSTNSAATNAVDISVGKTNSSSDAETNSPTIASQTHRIKNEMLASVTSWLGHALPKIGSWFLNQIAKAGALVDAIIAIILIPVYAFYFLNEKRNIKKHWTNYLPVRDSKTKDETIFILTAINQYMVAFFRGQVLVALCNGVLYTIGFFIIGLDYAFLLGFLAVGLTMIPFLGAIINCIIALVLTAVQFSDWLHPLLVLVVFAIVQSLESFFITPKVMGHRVGLHPVVIIIAVMVGTTLFGGLLGGVLAIPVAAALRVVMFRYVWEKKPV